VILDTDLLIALLNGIPAANKAIKHLEEDGELAQTTILNVYELLRGAQISSHPENNLAQVQALISNVEVIDLNMQACEEGSKIYRDLRKTGQLIGEFDTLIAAIAKATGTAVLTRDNHFTHIQGITVINW
jgi:predicted nucleic acid-binding protein